MGECACVCIFADGNHLISQATNTNYFCAAFNTLALCFIVTFFVVIVKYSLPHVLAQLSCNRLTSSVEYNVHPGVYATFTICLP